MEDCGLKGQLEVWLKDARRIAIMGVGNTFRHDDGIGSIVVKKLSRFKLPSRVGLFDCEAVPENYIDKVRRFKPTHILIVDSAYLNLKPGEVRLVSVSKIKGLAVSTHTLPLTYTAKYLKKFTGAKISLLAIQPKNVDFGLGLSPELKEASKRLIKLIVEVLGENF